MGFSRQQNPCLQTESMSSTPLFIMGWFLHRDQPKRLTEMPVRTPNICALIESNERGEDNLSLYTLFQEWPMSCFISAMDLTLLAIPVLRDIWKSGLRAYIIFEMRFRSIYIFKSLTYLSSEGVSTLFHMNTKVRPQKAALYQANFCALFGFSIT